jgi:hypothetical protein
MAVRTVQPLIQAAACDRPIAGWSRITALSRWRRCRRSAALGRGCSSAAAGRGGRRQGALSLPVRNVILIARGSWPGRSVSGFAAGPVRPMIGNCAGTSPETEAKAQRYQRQKRPIEYHATCLISPSARGMG